MSRRHAFLILVVAGGMAAILLAMGRLPIAASGTIELWHGRVNDAGNSQHLSDWYSPSHLIHGLIFYAVLRLAMPRASLGLRASLAAVTEAAWEIAENTPAVINRYREATAALGYTGDSVLNSLSDLGFMLLGFWLASRLPPRASVALAVGLELLTLVLIRDNLTLNVLMLVHPVPAIRDWQASLPG
ncbi:DUF2585 domain-containing protein [Roseomonas sp. CCTCC AB2023176]|uniref:DUF2585 domain-containing protein n=1 Tax=Roseomonas sp. CCTCC AB2023176 TaxID=3342640 RepID=UPI0035DFD442